MNHVQDDHPSSGLNDFIILLLITHAWSSGEHLGVTKSQNIFDTSFNKRGTRGYNIQRLRMRKYPASTLLGRQRQE